MDTGLSTKIVVVKIKIKPGVIYRTLVFYFYIDKCKQNI